MSVATLRYSSASLRDLCAYKVHYLLVGQHRRLMCNLSTTNISETDPPLPLLGPPEIYLTAPPVNPKLVTKKKPASASSAIKNAAVNDQQEPKTINFDDPFMNLMVSNYNTPFYSPKPPRPYRGYTENCSPTFLSSGNHCLDFFFHVVPDTPRHSVTRRLELAWQQDPLTALKLICNLRGVRGTGKGDREGFYSSALWLHQKHPKTLACNAPAIAEFGYFKDLPEILHRLLEGPDVRERVKKERERRRMLHGEQWYKCAKFPRIATEKQRIASGKKCVERYNSDPIFSFLHNQVTHLFAEALNIDMENVKTGKLRSISFAAKWCPSLYAEYDRSTLLCEGIARRLFPPDLPEYEGIEDAHYAYRVRDRLRKEVLVPLRQALKLPEIYMTANRWNELPYGRVPSIAMKNYEHLFFNHDKDRFEEYLDSVKSGKRKIAAGALLPHEIVKSLSYGDNQVAELQWQRIVDDLSAIGKLKNCLAISDVSGSMCGIPMEVSVALGMLVSELSEEPWKGKLITFSANPQLQLIEGTSLWAKVESVKRMYWDMNTDFQKVFDKILEVAKAGKLSEDQMIKRLFVFSDMEFDQASLNPWETDYEAICRKFKESGYTSVPEIVFWNLRESKATPVPSHQKGVSLVSGFSKNILKVFLENGGELNPEDTMQKAIAGEEYNKLVVID